MLANIKPNKIFDIKSNLKLMSIQQRLHINLQKIFFVLLNLDFFYLMFILYVIQ